MMTVHFKDGVVVEFPLGGQLLPYVPDPAFTAVCNPGGGIVGLVVTTDIEYVTLP